MHLISGATMLGHELENFTAPPSWRKATRNMILATESLERAFKKVPAALEVPHRQVGLVIGTNSGELDTSSEFLLNFSRSKLARPILFQNSLHNATAGFASIHFGVTGPVFTLSSGAQTPAESVATARMLFEEGLCETVAVTLVESHSMMSGLLWPHDQRPSEGACTLIFVREVFDSNWSARPGWATEISSSYTLNPIFSPLFDIRQSEFYQVAREYDP